MEGHSVISADVLARYAADAALEVRGVARLAESSLHRHRGVRVIDDDGNLTIELHLRIDWGASASQVAATVQERVARYLGRMTDVVPRAVDVVVDEFGPPPAD